MPTQLIINADDFGAAGSINIAVARAHREGALTSASLMVAGDAAREAVAIAKENPGLAVGLHLALSRARSMLPPAQIPDIVDKNSQFAYDSAKAGLKYYFSRKARQQLRREIEAQFEAFADTGLPLSHVDGHQHMHAHPVVLPIVIELAQKYGARGIRIPREPFLLSLKLDRSHLLYKLPTAAGNAYLSSVCNRMLRGSSLACCDITIGALMSGMMNSDYVIGMLNQLSASRVEVYFHPADLPEGSKPLDAYGPNRGDLLALLSPQLRRFIEEGGYELTNYPGIAASGGSCERC